MKTNVFTSSPQKDELINESPALVFIADMSTRNILWCNKTMVETLGYSLSEMQQMGAGLFEIIMHPEDYVKALIARELFMAGVKRHRTACRFQKKSTGEWNWFYGIAVVYEYDKDGKAKTLFCSFLELDRNQPVLQSKQHMLPSIMNSTETESLSHREKELLPYLAGGLSNEEIARLVFNSPNTIKTHVESVMGKLDIHSRTKLVAFLKDMGY